MKLIPYSGGTPSPRSCLRFSWLAGSTKAASAASAAGSCSPCLETAVLAALLTRGDAPDLPGAT